MADKSNVVNYGFWDSEKLVKGFNEKKAISFFRSESEFLTGRLVSKVSSVLDVGCSCGRFVDFLDSRGFEGDFTGLDISTMAVALCQKNYPEHQFILENVLQFSSNLKYSLVNATGVAQHETRFKPLVEKLISLSSRYVLFDVKLANISEPLIDIERCYCEVNGQRIHMVVLSREGLARLLEPYCGAFSVKLLAYETPINASTVRPLEIRRWASCGVFIDKKGHPGLHEVEMPPFLVSE